MKITAIDSFRIEFPISEEDSNRGVISRLGVTRVRTDRGIVGYGFRPTPENLLVTEVRPALIGAELLSMERFLELGLERWPAVDFALWDAIGKAAGAPVSRLLGGYRARIPVYLTIVWPGNPDQSDVDPEAQAQRIAEYSRAGFRAFKIRIWRPDPMRDVEVLRRVRELAGGRDKVELMFDRTAELPGSSWDYPAALRAARALEELEATWLEEPFARDRDDLAARLAAEVRIPITGGEADRGTPRFRDYLTRKSYDVIQPDVYNCGGITLARKIATLAESFGAPCIPHGTHGPALAGWLAVAASVRSCRILEMALQSPFLSPEEQWAPVAAILEHPEVFRIENGEMVVPDRPGLGLAVDDEKLEQHRVGD